MKYFYKIVLSISLLILSVQCIAQQENTLYFMDRIPQSQYLNPANHPDCKWWMSGLLVPVYLMPMIDPPFIHLPMYMDVSTPFSLSDIVMYKNGKPTSTFLDNTVDEDAFIKKLSTINNISNNISFEWLNVGFKQKKNYWDLSIQTKENFNFSFPKEYFAFILKGNIDSTRIGNGIFDGQGLNATVYQEASIGFNRQFSRYFRVGVRIKAIMGIANINTAKSQTKIYTTNSTDVESSSLPMTITSESNMLVNSSIPLVDVTNNTSNVPSSISLQKGITMQDVLKITKNLGWGLDFGLMKDWNSELTLYGSVIDLGFIRWKNNVQNYALTSNKFNYNGFPFSNLNLNDLSSVSDSLLNQFKNGFKAKNTQNTYRTSLNTKIFFGGNYKLTKKVSIGLLGRIDKYPFNYEYSGTASLNLKPFRWGTITLSESYFKKSFINFGLGYTIRIMAMQWFAVYDNLIGTAIVPERSRYWSMRTGVNLVFGRGNKRVIDKNKPLLNTL